MKPKNFQIYKSCRCLGHTLINHKFSNETLKSGKKYTWKLKYELHELVDYNGDNCNNDKIYSKDHCVDQIILAESLQRYGCATPFGIDKSQICSSNETEAFKIYDDGMNVWKWNGSVALSKECLTPCSIFTFSTKDFKSKDQSKKGQSTG